MKKILFINLLVLFLFNLYGWNVYQNVYLKEQTYSINYTDAVVTDVGGSNGISNLQSVLSTIIAGVSPSNFAANAPVFQLGTQSNSGNSYITMYYFTNNVAKGGEATSIIGNFNSGEIDRVIVTLNSNHGSLDAGDLWNWTSGTGTKSAFRSLKFILEHELLHCAGVAHTEIDGRLMFDHPFVSNLTGITVSNDEKLALNAIYNPPRIFEQNWEIKPDSSYTFAQGEKLKFKIRPTAANNNLVDYKVNAYVYALNNPYFPEGQTIVDNGTEITLDTDNEYFQLGANPVSIHLDGIESESYGLEILNAHKRGFTANLESIEFSTPKNNEKLLKTENQKINARKPKSNSPKSTIYKLFIDDAEISTLNFVGDTLATTNWNTSGLENKDYTLKIIGQSGTITKSSFVLDSIKVKLFKPVILSPTPDDWNAQWDSIYFLPGAICQNDTMTIDQFNIKNLKADYTVTGPRPGSGSSSTGQRIWGWKGWVFGQQPKPQGNYTVNLNLSCADTTYTPASNSFFVSKLHLDKPQLDDNIFALPGKVDTLLRVI